MARDMSKVSTCDATRCAYNRNNECHTIAITVGGPEDECACCDTYLNASRKGGASDTIGGVGACKVDQCSFNNSLECSAPSIKVGLHQGHPDCTTFKPR